MTYLPRILFVGTFPPHPGGSGVVNGHLLKGLHDAGHPLQVVTPSSPETARRADIVRRDFSGIALFETPVDHADTEPWRADIDGAETRRYTAATLAACDKAMRRERPDLVLTGRVWSLTGVADWARGHGLPLANACHEGAVLLTDIYPKARCQRGFDLLRRTDMVVAPAEHITAGLAREGIDHVVALPNAVDRELFKPGPRDAALERCLGLGPEHIVMIHTSNMKPVKRAGDIVKAAARAVESNERLVFLMIGDGTCREELFEAVRDQGLSDFFRFTGWVDREALPAYLRLAHMAVMPSQAEGLAMAYLEAMATGLVLLASDIPAAREVVADGENGFLFPPGDVEAIADAILKVAGDAALRRGVGAAARAHIERHHRLEPSVARLSQELGRLVNGHASFRAIREPRL